LFGVGSESDALRLTELRSGVRGCCLGL
jgi:hypothetical protein